MLLGVSLALLIAAGDVKEAPATDPGLLSNVFGNYMVLQRAPASALVWGTSKPNATVKIAFGESYLRMRYLQPKRTRLGG